jgi:acetyl/propionyl-CoA carboxylase alpha subunit
MTVRRLLVANRGEVAVRVLRAAADLGVETVAVAAADDPAAAHLRFAARAVILRGRGPAAYLDIDDVVAAATGAGCDALHPGYGFLSESHALAQACAKAGVTFVGPTPDQLRVLGDKTEARELAARCRVFVLPGTGPTDLAGARGFMRSIGAPVMLKAVAGGGGRGMRFVESVRELDGAWERCRSEAERAFGDGRLYVEATMPHARHIEVQVLGDGTGQVAHLGERDCTLQRRNQKIVEISPSPTLGQALREHLAGLAVRMAAEIGLANLCTFEFLVSPVQTDDGMSETFVFLEANPRLQVEHTVTEEITGVDLVAAQLRLAGGESLTDVLAGRVIDPVGYALQVRVNAERFGADGTLVPSTGTIERLDLPSGPGVRVDTAAFEGEVIDGGFDPLLAKVVIRSRSDDVAELFARARRVLAETRVSGIGTNLDLLRALLARPELGTLDATTRFVDDHAGELVSATDPPSASPGDGDDHEDHEDHVVTAPLRGAVVSIVVTPGQEVSAGDELAVLEAMKMEHVVTAPAAGTVTSVAASVGEVVDIGRPLAVLHPNGASSNATRPDAPAGTATAERHDLAEVLSRKAEVLDAARPDAVERRHGKGARTARENVDDLVDIGTFREYGGLAVAAQHRRRDADELRAKTPADGVVTGFGTVNGGLFGAAVARTTVIAFDETVLAGTMGEVGRDKLARVLDIAERDARPVVLLAEGGGGRAGDTDGRMGKGWTLDVSCYHRLGRLSGLVPLVGVTSGNCFAANAGALATCDVIIATRDAHLGVGGPSMIEGGRLGRYRADEIGPMSVQGANGVVDLLVDDEPAAIAAVKKYLGYFQGDLTDWSCTDQTRARALVPENRLRSYDVREVVRVLADDYSVLELRAGFGAGVVTALARVEGRPVGVIANNPMHLGGAIDTDAADKSARFMQLCEAFELPIVMLCDTPGMMVGPEAEKTATVRRMGRLFVTGANLSVPTCTVVLRKAYGIGAELMAGGWFRAPLFTVAWPTGEFGGMNLEGNVQLAYRAELDAIADPDARRARFDELLAELYEAGRATAAASHFEIDDVIDPADTRGWISSAFSTHRPVRPRATKKIPFVDTW